MRDLPRTTHSVGILILLVSLASPAVSQTYQVIDLGTLGGTCSEGKGINERGQVTGSACTAGDATSHAFISGPNGAPLADLGALGGTGSVGSGINASGQVTGFFYLAGTNTSHAFITGPDGVGMADLGTLGGIDSNGLGINATGQVTGNSGTASDPITQTSATHAFITGQNGVRMADLGTLGGTFSGGFGINATGQVTGGGTTSGDAATHAFITGPNGVGSADLGTFGGIASIGNGINASGQVTGSASLPSGVTHAFITGPNGVGLMDLGTLGGTFSVGYSINVRGDVAGAAILASGVNAGFVDFGGAMYDLNTLLDPIAASHVTISEATGINDKAWISATGTDSQTGQKHAYRLQALIVPGTADIFLAGQPSGTCIVSPYYGPPVQDCAPAQGAVDSGLTLIPGASLQFTVSGATNNSPSPTTASSTPDGGNSQGTQLFGPSSGLSGIQTAFNALVGVFLGPGAPDPSAQPPSLSFVPPTETSFQTIAPQLQQVFFIGDGLTGTGSGNRQSFVVPQGATRLMLGSSDGLGTNNNNPGFFIVSSVGTSLIDPVASNLIESNGDITANVTKLAASAQVVDGVAADDAAQVVVRIEGANVGDKLQLTLVDENGKQGTNNDLGYLATLLPVDHPAVGGSISVTAVAIAAGSQRALAFAVFHAPADFVRLGNQNNVASDPAFSGRVERIQISDLASIANPTFPVERPVQVVRPPVVLVHGIWGDPTDFTGANGNDGLFWALEDSGLFGTLGDGGIAFGRYDFPIQVASSLPGYSSTSGVLGNSLGFNYGATVVLPQIQATIANYRATRNVAAIRADVVAHSMGGNVTRTLPKVSGYFDIYNYGLGVVHKLITIGTPHQGSVLATALTEQQDNKCVRQVFAWRNRYAFRTAMITSGRVAGDPGGTGDLEPGSQAIVAIHSGPPVIPTAMIGAQLSSSQLASIGTGIGGTLITSWCGTGPNASPLALDLTPAGWTSLLGASDGIVPIPSQFDGQPLSYPPLLAQLQPGIPVRPAVHSSGTESLGFGPPAELDQSSLIPTDVIELLNTPVSASIFERKP